MLNNSQQINLILSNVFIGVIDYFKLKLELTRSLVGVRELASIIDYRVFILVLFASSTQSMIDVSFDGMYTKFFSKLAAN